MKNKIYHLSSIELIDIKEYLEKEGTFFIGEIDGEKIQKLQDYLDTVKDLFQFPINSLNLGSYKLNLNGYNDWMRDLDWLSKEGYVLIIYNFKQFLDHDPISKKKVINGLYKTILPFWEKEVEEVVVGGKVKPFNVYLVD